jgi:hypothetical protein
MLPYLATIKEESISYGQWQCDSDVSKHIVQQQGKGTNKSLGSVIQQLITN